MTSAKTGVLLVNLGTPDSTKTSDVRKYLREFLSDGRVLDINPVGRFLLVNLIIAPFRSPKSANEYRKLWTDRGSPLLYHSQDVAKMLQDQLGDEFVVRLGMRYQSPSLPGVLEEMKAMELKQIVVVPLFPQYASATSGSVHQKVMEIVGKWQLIPKMILIDEFATNPQMIETFVQNAKAELAKSDYDHYMFSYHGLPVRQLVKADPQCKADGECCSVYSQRNRLCYRAQCYETSRKLAEGLGLSEEQYTVCFQSRLGKTPWIQPYTEDKIKELAAKGVKRILAFSPSFVADCLETTVEIGEEYTELFEEVGGEHLQLVDSLNASPLWVDALKSIVEEALGLERAEA